MHKKRPIYSEFDLKGFNPANFPAEYNAQFLVAMAPGALLISAVAGAVRSTHLLLFDPFKKN